MALVNEAPAIILVLAHLVRLVERSLDPQFNKPYLRAIGVGLWETVLIIATAEHGERENAKL